MLLVLAWLKMDLLRIFKIDRIWNGSHIYAKNQVLEKVRSTVFDPHEV